MKKNLLILILIGFMFSITLNSCNKDDDDDDDNTPLPPPVLTVEDQQRPLVLCFASNKNSTTGTVLPYFEKAAQARQGECIPIVLPDNSSSQLAPYYRKENDELVYKTNLSGFFQKSLGINVSKNPAVYVNSRQLNHEVSNLDFFKDNVIVLIDNETVNFPAVGIDVAARGGVNSAKIWTKTKFFNKSQGKYRIGLYLLESNLVFKQNVGGSVEDDFVHNYVMRGNLGDGIASDFFNYGVELKPGVTSFEVDDEFENEFEYEWAPEHFELPDGVNLKEWDKWEPSKYYVVAIIWKLTDPSRNIYEFINGTIEKFQ
jgi:hypothetical protein